MYVQALTNGPVACPRRLLPGFWGYKKPLQSLLVAPLVFKLVAECA